VESRLGFRVAGKITRRQAELGQRVKAGQVLAQLDPQDYKLAADAARAQVAAAQTNRDLAAADFKRFAALKDQNFISGAELERRDTTLKAAQAQLEQAQAQLSRQGNQAGYTNLVADVSGVVTAMEAEPARWWPPARRWCALRRTARATWCLPCPKTRWRPCGWAQEVAVRAWAAGR
jgi:multidrug efflux system membrane fusion protein